jgi:hypothetical protein
MIQFRIFFEFKIWLCIYLYETKPNEMKRNQTKPNETERNERNRSKRNETKCRFVSFDFVSFRFDRFRFVLFEVYSTGLSIFGLCLIKKGSKGLCENLTLIS